MGHISNTTLNLLSDRTIGCELSKTKGNLLSYNTCIQAKATAKVSREPASRVTEYLEKVHSDICGPIKPEI
jgi:hypothetical protein